ncbi:helix-turn-helix domain-containing protein [Candidatus Bathyarchaeota archaeon]|nr:MAG: helix-turn-helix domain-containing protein [Candidatus Bathyarchaeota archaeon]
MNRTEILDNVESLFEDAGFHLSRRCCTKPHCFDFVARREDNLLFTKVQTNIGNIYEKDAYGLTTLSDAFHATSLFICEKTRNKPIEDDTLYMRYGVRAITLRTLEDALFQGFGPLIEAGPGGYYVKLDGEAMRKERLENGLSMGKVAEVLGVSRRTLYGYERGLAKASVLTSYKLASILGIPVVEPLDLFQPIAKTEGFLATARRIISESRFLRFIIEKLRQFNFTVFQLRRAPFDFVARSPMNGVTLIGAIAYEEEDNFAIKTEEIVSISKVVGAQPIYLTDSDNIFVDSIPLIQREDFKKIKCCEDLMARF